ncbi:hypothetical protein [Pseudomonas cichorii]|uniref:Uncharacterized protein n=1 Tax=Pseudomonas cichorii TaxID=36746 RepID=A0ABQ1DLN7_PSECI|nr:hypothetical protein [Pseudomonas cichorii]QVE16518.1 hypothetical protein KGD89_22045 [Pseudomonas cichorii]GFM77212.1 hypothetical protein PSCICM_30310 [Pseudomonas cichorii]GFM91945.1 hypothetical protein PSCICP_19170 [Pseudomonas cichorii]
MEHVVSVVRGITPHAYDSLPNAVALSRVTKERKEKCDLIGGGFVVAYELGGDSLVLSFNNGWHLVVSAGDNRVDWDVVPVKPAIKEGGRKGVVYRLHPDGEIVLWKPRIFLNKLLGKQAAISPSNQYLFLFVRDEADYIFDFLINVDIPDERFLFLSEV